MHFISPRRAGVAVFSLCLMMAALAANANAHAGSLSWAQEKVSPALNYAGQNVVVQYAKPGRPAMGRIVRVHASRGDRDERFVESELCWNGLDQCVPLNGSALTTDAFKGRDASRPFYLVHRVKGKGPLGSPLFVKGSVIVWFEP